MVSVIIPVFNAEKTLPDCVRSIQRQTYSDYELIFIDDGSKDRSGQICDDFRKQCAEKGISCQVIHQENGGVSKARNCGMDHANGEYFVCVDSDDVVEPCYLEDLVRSAQMHPELGHVLCSFRCTSHVHDYVFSDQDELSVLNRSDYMLLSDKILVQGPCLALYRTEIVRKHKIRMREDLSLAEDTLFNLEYLDALDRPLIGVVNKPNYIYQNENPNSLNRKYRPDLLHIQELTVQSIKQYMCKWKITDDDSWRRFYNASFFKYLNVFENTFHSQNPMSLREKINYNNTILKSESFRNALKKSAVNLPAVQRRAYQSGKYGHVLIAERIQEIKIAASSLLRRKKDHRGDLQ